MEKSRYYELNFDGNKQPIVVTTKRFYVFRDEANKHSSGRRYVQYHYYRLTGKKLLDCIGKIPVGEFNKQAVKLTKEEYDRKVLTITTLYGTN